MYDLTPNTFICADCADVMREMADGVADLVLTDPPYGIGMDVALQKNSGAVGPCGVRSSFASTNWDEKAPQEIIPIIRRVSKNQIVWGGNYFVGLPASSCWLVWDKRCGITPQRTYADCELAYCSQSSPARIFRWLWDGMLQGNMADKEKRYHPTQKPVPLFVWCLLNYSKPGDLIIDPYCGSGTTALACHKTGRRFICIDKEPEYIRIAQERYQALVAQQDLFPCQDNVSETLYNNGMELTLPL
jgi:site-specific DNA-methyltransferase (adenine-specific)